MNKFIGIGLTLLLALFLAGCKRGHDSYTFTVKGLADGESVLFASGEKQAAAVNDGCVNVEKDDLDNLVASFNGVEACSNKDGSTNVCGKKSRKGGFEITKSGTTFSSSAVDKASNCTNLAAAGSQEGGEQTTEGGEQTTEGGEQTTEEGGENAEGGEQTTE